MENNSIDSSIDRFSAGEMTPEEIRAFQDEVSRDPESAKLLAAEQLLQRSALSERLAADAAPLSSPSRSLMTYLYRTTRMRSLYYGFSMAGFTLLLGFVVYLTSQQHPVLTPPSPANQSVIATDTAHPQTVTSDHPAATPLPVTKQIVQQQSTKPAQPVAAPEKDRDFDEPKGKPRVFGPDSLPVRLRTR